MTIWLALMVVGATQLFMALENSMELKKPVYFMVKLCNHNDRMPCLC